MINRNNLLIETHTLPEKMQHDHVMLISFLETMARFHKYNVDEQINIHLHAPSSAVALASAAIWQKYFNTSIIADAQPTPILKNAQTSNETIEYIYDLVDTESFQAGKFNLTDIYWQYSDSDKTVVKNYLNESDSDSIEKAIHIAVQKQAAIADTDYPSLLAAATEYIIKARLHLPNSSMVINSIDCSSINMKKFLIETNQLAKQFLTPIGKVISNAHKQDKSIESASRINNENIIDAIDTIENNIPVHNGQVKVKEQILTAGQKSTDQSPISISYTINSSIKSWFINEHPDDELVECLNDITFTDLLNAIEEGNDVYKTIGTGDSVIREELFTELAVLSNKSYEDIYDSWIASVSAPVQEININEPVFAAESTANEPSTIELNEADTNDANEILQSDTADDVLADDIAELNDFENDAKTAESTPIAERPEDDDFTGIDIERLDFTATMDSAEGKRAVFLRNLAAIQIVNHLEESGHRPNKLELKVLKAYSGFGGIAEVFDAHNHAWSTLYQLAQDELTPAQYNAAKESTLTAYYTPHDIIKAIYQGLNVYGFKHGNILDPSTGNGRFLDDMPDEMKNNSNLVGIEIDMLTAQVAKYANPSAHIINSGFEKTNFANNSFDLAISNIPFGNFAIYDKRYPDHNYLIHDYFIKRMLDQVRPGGVVAVITSRGTMDKKNDSVRKELASKAELVKAVRFPKETFNSAGTEAVSDLIILRKRERELAPNESLPEWVNSVTREGKITGPLGGKNTFTYQENQYFIDHPENIIGNRIFESTPFGYDIGIINQDNVNIAEKLTQQLAKLPSEYTPLKNQLPIPEEESVISDNAPYGFYVDKNRKLYYLSPENKKECINLSSNDTAKILSAAAIRDTLRTMFDDELKNCDDNTLGSHQVKLNELYKKHIEKYGPINNDRNLKKLFAKDSSYALLLSLERIEDDKVIALSDVFTKRTIHAYKAPTHTDTAEEALIVSMQEKGMVDIPYMSSLTGFSKEKVVEELEFKAIFEDLAEKRFMTADEYLSGDVRSRINITAKALAAWKKDLYAYAVDMVTASPDFPLYHEADYPKRYSDKEIRKRADAAYSFNILNQFKADEEIAFLFSPENRSLLFHILKNDNALTEGVFHSQVVRYCQMHPEEKAVIDSPEFVLDMMAATHKAPCKLIYAFAGGDVISWIAKAAAISHTAPLSKIDYTFLKEMIHEQEKSTEKLSRKFIAERYELFTQEIMKKIENIQQDKSDQLVAQYLFDIERFEKNIVALNKVKPRDLTAKEINVNLGATWVPVSDIDAFVAEVFNTRNINTQYSALTGDWKIGNKKHSNMEICNIYGTKAVNALELLENALNHKQKIIHKVIIANGNEQTIVDQQATILAAQKMQKIREAFQRWIFKDEKRTARLVTYYNEHFNNIVPRQFDGSHLKFPGMNPEIKLYEHQKEAIAHSLYGGNTLFAHAVGAGKTFEMQASAMESKRIGLCRKPLFIMPKHLTEQFGASFLRLYPNANVLIATPEDSEQKNRRKFAAKISSLDWDAVIMSYEQFGKMPLSLERQQVFIQKEIDAISSGLAEMRRQKGKNDFSVKQTQRQLKKLKAQLDKITEAYNKHQDATITFEQTGIDRLYVDEAHNFKNLGFFTKMSGVASEHKQKTDDLMAKIDYLNELTGERGVVFASGTPISNSFAELYTVQRYLKPSRLKAQGLEYFDAWASNFGQEVTQLELSPDGKSYKNKTRFAKFNNVPELMSMYHEFADVKTSDMLTLAVPDVELIIDKVKPSDMQKKLVDDLVQRAQLIAQNNPRVVNEEAHALNAKRGLDNMLTIIGDGRKAALDPRILNPEIPDNPDSKVNHCVKNVSEIYHATAKDKLTQVIFCDLSTPKNDGSFTVYKDIVAKLKANGIDRKQIAVIHDYEKPEQKEALFRKVCKGEVRIIIGSSDKLGIGTNIQDRLVAMHDLDCPWKPSQIEQRRGRGVRQGNINKKIKHYRYITEGTFDAFMWQTNERKQQFIAQIMTGKTPCRSIDDMDETKMEYAQIKSACTDNPLFKEQMELTQQVDGLKFERIQYQEMLEKLRPRVEIELPQNIAMFKKKAELYRADLAMLADHPDSTIIIANKEFAADKIGKALAKICEAYRDNKINATLHGTYRGLNIDIIYHPDETPTHKYEIFIHGHSTIRRNLLLTNPANNAFILTNIENTLRKCINNTEASANNSENDLAKFQIILNQPFEKEQEYQEKSRKLAEVNAQVISAQDQETLEIEQRKRTRQIADPNQYKGDDLTFMMYLSLANEAYLAQGSIWDDKIDQKVTKELKAKGYPNDAIKNAILNCSPACPDKENLDTYINKSVEQKGR